ncbi:MAG: beta-galactosidase trimerization domain-containing protein [Candidatus Omnitrophica bacterium]|nr:beta-galactosidase trimerization domain-containing protein [Candidatus Omnitrophota bacterium]
METERKRRLLFDFHMPDFLDELRLDVKKYVADLMEMKVQWLTFMTKSSFGNCYYHSRVGVRARGLKGDILKEVIPLLREKDIKIIAYYNVSLNDIESNKHPDWRAIDSHGQKVRFEYYDQLCLNSPLQDLVEKQTVEIVENYDVDGLWLDLTYMARGGCFCRWCQKLFAEKYGQPLRPEIKKDPAGNRKLSEFMRFSRFQFLNRIHSAVKKINPSLLIGWNHAGDFYFNEIEIDRLADFSSVEFHPPYYPEGSLRARYMRNLGKPFELMIPETLKGWGDWTVMPFPTMKLMATICLMNGGSINIGHVVVPCGEFGGQIAPGVKQTIKQTFAWVKKVSPYSRGKSVPVNAIFYSAENSRLIDAQPNTEDDFSQSALNSLFGLGKILLSGNIHFDILGEAQINKIHQFEILFLPDIRFISEPVRQEIFRFVEKGGKLVATYLTGWWNQDGELNPLSSFRHLLGVEMDKLSSYSVTYLYRFDKKIINGLPDMPILVNESAPDRKAERKCVYVKPLSAQPLAYVVEPIIESDHQRYYHIYHRYSPPGKTTRYPGITLNNFGQGKVLYFSFPLEAAFNFSGSPWLRKIIYNCLEYLNPEPRLKVQAASTVEVNLTQLGSTWFLHLLNTSLSRQSDYKLEESPPLEVECIVRKEKVRKITALLSRRPVNFSRSARGIRFRHQLSDYEVLKIE